ncbi:helix-turn-helix domain-containing protein [Saccharothrix syringae]|uniref:XRE family transcriptional regulator n=1 Tax=Saccharothrix syringae TaxID=103733 RepID=A0A5Q0GSQ2_SACSY|nr:helix-turn-helix transcriptional regulator [Saccharothrix syringae]QFZ16943.1 XRE family transcriptional regulator [Saccharothrix syringae]
MSHTIKLRTFEFVQAARSARLHSDYALARAMGVNRSTVTRVIRGELQPGPAFIGGALTALDGQFDDLFEVVPVARRRGGS